MYGNEIDKVQVPVEKVEKFSVRVTGTVTTTTGRRLQSHHSRMIDTNKGGGTVKFTDALRDVIQKGLEVAENPQHQSPKTEH